MEKSKSEILDYNKENVFVEISNIFYEMNDCCESDNCTCDFEYPPRELTLELNKDAFSDANEDDNVEQLISYEISDKTGCYVCDYTIEKIYLQQLR